MAMQLILTQDVDNPDLTCEGDHLTCDSLLASAKVTVENPAELGTLTYVWSTSRGTPAPCCIQTKNIWPRMTTRKQWRFVCCLTKVLPSVTSITFRHEV